MNIQQQIYNALEAHCGHLTKIKGTTEQSLRNMKKGIGNPSVTVLKTLFEENGIKGKLTLNTVVDGKKVKTEIEWK